MGPEVAAILPYLGAAASVVGTVSQMNAQDDAQSRSKNAFNQNLLRDQEYQKKQTNLVQENAQQYEAPVRQAGEAAAVDSATQSLTSNLLRDREAAVGAGDASGKVSQDFTTGRAKRVGDELQRSTDIARLMARVRGPSDQRAGEAITNADFAGRGSSLGADRGFMAGAGNTDAQVAGQPDGTQMLLGGAASNIGTGMLANGLRRRAPTAAPAWQAGDDWF